MRTLGLGLVTVTICGCVRAMSSVGMDSTADVPLAHDASRRDATLERLPGDARRPDQRADAPTNDGPCSVSCSGCCQNGSCVPPSAQSTSACGAGGQLCLVCFHNDPCALDICSLGGCTHTPRPAGSICIDGKACTELARCQNGSCVALATKDCSALSDACHVGTCAEAAKGCVATPQPNGATCVGAGSAAGKCLSGACCTGCVGGGLCLPGDTTTICGHEGESCKTCPAVTECRPIVDCTDGDCESVQKANNTSCSLGRCCSGECLAVSTCP
jgi:hypothetical protein